MSYCPAPRTKLSDSGKITSAMQVMSYLVVILLLFSFSSKTRQNPVSMHWEMYVEGLYSRLWQSQREGN